MEDVEDDFVLFLPLLLRLGERDISGLSEASEPDVESARSSASRQAGADKTWGPSENTDE